MIVSITANLLHSLPAYTTQAEGNYIKCCYQFELTSIVPCDGPGLGKHMLNMIRLRHPDEQTTY